MTSIPSYIPIPSSARLIDSPTGTPTPKAPAVPISNFPPTSQNTASTSSRKFSVPTATSISTNVSDLLLSSLLPTNLPKLSQATARNDGPGRPRELSTQREQLSLPLVSNNFRRFVTKVGPLFWVQDRIEEILFWRKPIWTWAWIMTWTLTSFKPRLLLVIPSLSLLILLLHVHERSTPTSSLLGVPNNPQPAGTARVKASTSNSGGSITNSASYSTSTGPDGENIPVVPPKESESSVDYYMNLQAIQNLMGLVSDIYDYVSPRLSTLIGTSSTFAATTSSPFSFPLTPTHLILILLPPSLFLPILPGFLIPYLLLPIGILPPLFFHPNLSPLIFSMPRNPKLLRLRALMEDLAMTDALPDELGQRQIGRVEVWENERLDPTVASKTPSSLVGTSSAASGSSISGGAWSARFLRAGERAAWVKVLTPSETDVCFSDIWFNRSIRNIKGKETLWKVANEGGLVDMRDHSLRSTTDKGKDGDRDGEAKIILALKDGWDFIPQEDWKIDVCGLWSDVGCDEDGWVYSDDSWQNPASTAITDSEPAPLATGSTAMPALTLRRVTRRRRWWRRVSLGPDRGSTL